MKSAVPNTDDEIEVTEQQGDPWGRIRIRERQGGGLRDVKKCSIFLGPDQLEQHAKECLALATKLRALPSVLPMDPSKILGVDLDERFMAKLPSMTTCVLLDILYGNGLRAVAPFRERMLPAIRAEVDRRAPPRSP